MGSADLIKALIIVMGSNTFDKISKAKNAKLGNLGNAAISEFYNNHLLKYPEVYNEIFQIKKMGDGPVETFNLIDIDKNSISYQDYGQYILTARPNNGPQTGGCHHNFWNIIQRGGMVQLLFFNIFDNVKYAGLNISNVLENVYINPYNPAPVNGIYIPPGTPVIAYIPPPPPLPPQPDSSDHGDSSDEGPPEPDPPQPDPPEIVDPNIQTILNLIHNTKKMSLEGLPEWVTREEILSEYILDSKRKKIWDFFDGSFRPKISAGFTTNDTFKNTCNFMEDSSKKHCIGALASCLHNSKKNPQSCLKLVKLDYKNLNSVQVIDLVSKLDPRHAFEILTIFHFGWYTDIIKLPPVNKNSTSHINVEIYKVEPLGSWLSQLVEETNMKPKKCFQGYSNNVVLADQCNPISTQLGETVVSAIRSIVNDPDTNNHGFLKFLGYLVSWVNANPVILNNEIKSEDTYKNDDGFTANPSLAKFYHLAERSRTTKPNDLICTVKTLRKSYDTPDNLYNKLDLLSIVQMGGDISMPLNRNIVANPHGIYDMEMTGGIIGVDGVLRSNEESLIGQILNDILSELKLGARTSGNYSIPKKIMDEMRSEINIIMEKEKHIRDLTKQIMLEQKVNRESRGLIDISGFSKKKTNEILIKHGLIASEQKEVDKYAMHILDLVADILGTSKNDKPKVFRTWNS